MARAVANAYGQAVRASRWPVSTNPPADLLANLQELQSPGALIASHCEAARRQVRAFFRQDQRRQNQGGGSAVPLGMPFANRLCPDENLLRQNVAI